MPGGNRKGPGGEGPRTGRGAGFCSGSESPGYETRSPRRRIGNSRIGMNRRSRKRLFSSYSPDPLRTDSDNVSDFNETESDEIQYLQNKAAYLEAELKKVLSRIEDIASDDNQP